MYRQAGNKNLFVTGQSYSGKSRIVDAITRNHGYAAVRTGDVLLDHLQATTGRQGPFSTKEIVSAKDRLITERGPLYFLTDMQLDGEQPIVVDSVRSMVVARALLSSSFSAVHVVTDFDTRLGWALSDERSQHPAKMRTRLASELQALDDSDSGFLSEIAAHVHVRVRNSNDAAVQELADRIVKMTASGLIEQHGTQQVVPAS